MQTDDKLLSPKTVLSPSSVLPKGMNDTKTPTTIAIDRMFEKEKDYANLKLGCKATVFDKDPNIQIRKRRGNFTLLKYTKFS